MHERVAELVQDLTIELDLLSFDAERHLLVELPRHVAHEAGKPIEHLPYRRHAGLNDLVLEIGGETRDVDRDLVDVGVLSHPARGQLVQAAALGHELADQIHEGIEPPQIHADVAATAAGRDGLPGSGGDLTLIRSAAQRDALDVSHGSNSGLDVRGRRGGLELERKPAVEVVRLEGGGRGLDPVNRAQRLHFANDQHGTPPFEGRFGTDQHVDETRRSRRSRRGGETL